MEGLESYLTLKASLNEELSEYLSSNYGADYVERVKISLPRPPRQTTIRANTLRITVDELKAKLESALGPGVNVERHALVPEVLVITPPPPPVLDINTNPLGGEVSVNRTCAMAVLRGSDVFAKGILAASPSITAGTQVLISVPWRHYETRY